MQSIYDNSNFLNPDNSVRKELCYYKRKINTQDLINSILEYEEKINVKELIEQNKKNGWKEILSNNSINDMFLIEK